ncbi:MAG: class I SAM-dependent methyltransferase [Pseudonocardiaceae bacterium]
MNTRDDRPDFSAESAAAARAYSHRKQTGPERNPDHLAHLFLGPGYGFVYRVDPLAKLAYVVWQRRIPGIVRYLNARTQHIDRVLREAVCDGAIQVVILGAGYDTRAWRLRDELAGIPVFEVDRRGTQRRKREVARRTLGTTPENLRYVEVDFGQADTLFPRLREHGYADRWCTLFVWEGVSYYLPPEDVDALLANVAANAVPGSSIVFDYLYRSVLDGGSTCYGAEGARRYLERRGQPFRSGLPDGDSAGFLRERGYQLVEDLDPDAMRQTYLQSASTPLDGQIFGGYGMVLATVSEARPP